jgi:hypothetical protein
VGYASDFASVGYASEPYDISLVPEKQGKILYNKSINIGEFSPKENNMEIYDNNSPPGPSLREERGAPEGDW